MITLSNNSVVAIRTLISGYDPLNSAEKLCPTRRARNSKLMSDVERMKRRRMAGKKSGLSASELHWLNEFTRTGRYRRDDDTGTLELVI